MKNFIAITAFFLASVVTGCAPPPSNTNDPNPIAIVAGAGAHAGPLSLSLTANTRGDVVLGGQVAIPLIGNTELGFDGIAGFEITLMEAQEKAYHLFILWENESGEIHRDTYDIGQTFNVEFGQRDWVRKIHTDERGNVIVFVEQDAIIRDRARSSRASSNPINNEHPASACQATLPARLSVGGNASVVIFQVKVRTEPGKSASLVQRKYYKQNRVLRVLDGPICEDNWLWWNVYSDELGYGGWVSEGDEENYYLAP